MQAIEYDNIGNKASKNIILKAFARQCLVKSAAIWVCSSHLHTTLNGTADSQMLGSSDIWKCQYFEVFCVYGNTDALDMPSKHSTSDSCLGSVSYSIEPDHLGTEPLNT